MSDYELGNYENVYQDKIIRTKAMLIQFAVELAI